MMLIVGKLVYQYQRQFLQSSIVQGSSLKENEIDILINYLLVGSQKVTEYLSECCLESSVSLLNCIPVFIASDPEWDKKFYDKGILIPVLRIIN
ncbi:Inositol-3-phosphate synthase [Photorhabdus namnaonensis]|uniref:Inositol-3-phosphate synthase n=1 Tax=Photorhabdus namnaonensis TaxID=1851568 RepID=A0A1B8YD61_9GAMM|nr:Inositol-3-phosphate synthase [Photorhabdus namnaonensis]